MSLRYEQAQQVLDRLFDATAVAVAVEQPGPQSEGDPVQTTDRSLARLDDLADRLEAAQQGGAGRVPSTSFGEADFGSLETEFERIIEQACRAPGGGQESTVESQTRAEPKD